MPLQRRNALLKALSSEKPSCSAISPMRVCACSACCASSNSSWSRICLKDKRSSASRRIRCRPLMPKYSATFSLPQRGCWRIRLATCRGRLLDRKSTRLNSSHVRISYAVFCLKKKKSLECMLEGDEGHRPLVLGLNTLHGPAHLLHRLNCRFSLVRRGRAVVLDGLLVECFATT